MVRTRVMGLHRATIRSSRQIRALIEIIRTNIRTLRMNSRLVGPLGARDTGSGAHMFLTIHLPTGGSVKLLKVSGSLQLREHDNRAGFSEAATKQSAVARRTRVGATNQANLAITNVLGWMA